MNKKKLNSQKTYQEDNINNNKDNLIQSQINNQNSHSQSPNNKTDIIIEPNVLNCIDLDFDETDDSNLIQSTQFGSNIDHNSMSTTT